MEEESHVVTQNNVRIPILGLGTSHNGGYSHEAVVSAVREFGYRHIDTAKRYGCEAFIGEDIKESGIPREELFLASKCWPTDYGKNSTIAAFLGSCQRLETDYLDMYLLHWPYVPSHIENKKELIQETWRDLELLYDKESIRVIGVSNFLQEDLESLLEDCSVPPQVNQCEFHPYNNSWKLRNFCHQNHIQFGGYSPLADGKVMFDPVIQSIAKSHDKSPSQIVIRWNIQHQVICIPKSTKPQRVQENCQVFDFKLSDTEMELIDTLPQNYKVMDRSLIQGKIDNPLPDGYRLHLNSV